MVWSNSTYLSNMINYFCIHHDLAVDRKEYIVKNIPIKNVIWITSYPPTSNFITSHQKVYSEHSSNKSFLSLSELSCYYKHLEAIKKIGDSHSYGFVFEDDIEKPPFDIVPTVEKFAQDMRKNDIDILFIGSYGSFDLPYTNYNIVCNQNTQASRCAHAYMINNNIVDKIKHALLDIKAPFDWQLNFIIHEFNLKSGWTYPHIYQRTEKQKIRSLLR